MELNLSAGFQEEKFRIYGVSNIDCVDIDRECPHLVVERRSYPVVCVISGQNAGCAAEDNIDIARGGQRHYGRKSGQEARTNGCGEGATDRQLDARLYQDHLFVVVDVVQFIQSKYVLCVNASRQR
jgi:hypothetical protein